MVTALHFNPNNMLEFTTYYKRSDGSIWLTTIKADNVDQAITQAKLSAPEGLTYSHTGGTY